MRSAKHKLLFLSLLLVGMLLPSHVFAADENPGMEQVKSDLNDVKDRLTALAEQQKVIIAKEDNILEEVNRVRIWVHRK